MSFPTEEHRAKEDEDHLFLDQVLNKLYDFGDGAGKRKSKSQKRKGCAEEDHHEKDIRENADPVNDETNSDQHMTDVTHSAVCQNTVSGTLQSTVEVVTFVDPLKKKKRFSKTVEPEQKTHDIKDEKKTDVDARLEIEKARFEVHRFGLSAYQKPQQRVYEQDRAVMLGARPPKKQYVNYKEYQEMIKEQKLKAREEAKSDPQRRKRREGQKRTGRGKWSSGGQLGGQVGRFKNGMLVLSSKDIQKVNVKRRK